MFPVCKIQIYDFSNSDALLYTFDSTTGTFPPFDIKIRSQVTEGLGTGHFSLPSKTVTYSDIAVHDKVAVYLGFDSIPATATFVGRLTSIDGLASKGYVKRFNALDLGEVLRRRIKKAKYWYATNAHTIADAIAGDLLLGTDTDSDINDETILTVDETYFDLLKRISDYWVDAGVGHQVKKDFFVFDDSGTPTLAWKTRPLRQTPDVETFTEENMIGYQVTRDIHYVKNKIYVYGQKGLTNPVDRDEWTEDSTDGWSAAAGADNGTVTTDDTAGNYVMGDKSIKVAITTINPNIRITKTISQCEILSNDGYNQIKCLSKTTHPLINWTLRVYAPDSSNYYLYGNYVGADFDSGYFGDPTDSSKWAELTVNLNKIKYIVGTPTITDVEGLCFDLWHPGGWHNAQNFWIDGLRFEGKRFTSGIIQNDQSQIDYGIRELTFISDDLISNTECVSVANTFLYQLKDLPINIDMLVLGNTNLKVGDRLNITLSREGIPSTDFDVYAVEHSFNSDSGFTTKAEMCNLPDLRRTTRLNMSTALTEFQKLMKKIAKGQSIIGGS